MIDSVADYLAGNLIVVEVLFVLTVSIVFYDLPMSIHACMQPLRPVD